MSVTVAVNSGFCFGIKNATGAVEAELERAAGDKTLKIYTLGMLLHNNTYMSKLIERGVRVIDYGDLDAICEQSSPDNRSVVFVRAHGMTIETENKLNEYAGKNPYFRFVDCTCPFVRKIYGIVEQYSDSGRLLLVLGDETHPETVGAVSRYRGGHFVFSCFSQLKNAYEQKSVTLLEKISPILIAQTTSNLEEWTKTKKFIENLYTNPIIFDTICNVTDKRQREAEALSQDSDYMIVIGGKNSSNSAKLFSVCSKYCPDTVWIESAEELAGRVPFTHKKVGIVAGASTPHDIIEEVKATMSEQTFEELFEQSSPKTLNTGDTVIGYVTAISDGEIQLDLGAKVTGRIEFDQITDDPSVKLRDMFKIGDEVEAFVIRVSDIDGMATLSKKRTDADKNRKKIFEAKDSGEILEGKVIKAVKSGIIVSVSGNEVFVHESQTGTPKDTDLTTMIGQTVKLKITEVKEEGRKAKGSIRQVLKDEKRALEDDFWANVEEGKYYTGVVKSMTAYGAFIDLGGVDGMVHSSELSWKRIKSPAEVLSIGETVTVFVKSFDREKGRISLGYKTEETNPWYVFTHTYAIGDVATVKIVSMMPFGAFAEIVPGVDGLIHISQIADKKIGKPADVLELGQEVDAKILDIDMEKQNVTLSIRALIEEAKAAEEAAPAEEVAPADAE